MISSGVVEDTTATRGRFYPSICVGRFVEQLSLTITDSSIRNARI